MDAKSMTSTSTELTDPHVANLFKALDVSAMMQHLEAFSTKEKLAGSRSELESFEYLRRTLDVYGLETDLILHDAYISLPGKAGVEVDGATIDCITHSFSQPTTPEGVIAEIVYLGSGKAEDFEKADVHGRILLLDNIATPAVSLRASRAGAVGQIHISPLEHLYEMCISPVWGNPTGDQLALLPKTVVVTVRQGAGDDLKKRLANGEQLRARLNAEVDTGWRKTPILQADLKSLAPDAEDSFVLFSGHHDTWYYGVMDNGTANATMLELARLMSSQREKLRRNLRLCFWSGHSQGRYSSSSWYADTRWSELNASCVAHVNIDSTGGQGNTVLSDAVTSAELFDVATRAVKHGGDQDLEGHRMSRAGDQSFWGIGVPAVFMGMGEQPVGSDNPMGTMLGGANRKSAGFGWWWHTPNDTIDKISPEILARDARVYIHALWELLSARVLPFDFSRQLDLLVMELNALKLKVSPEIDIERLISRVKSTQEAARRVSEPEAPSTLKAVNAALIQTARALVPIDYTSGDRFEHDPALPQSPFPVLDPVRRLAAVSPGSNEAKFAAVEARRAINRISFALDTAHSALVSASAH